MPIYKINNMSSFRKMVYDIMNGIPYGKFVTYNDIAREITSIRGIKKMSAQSVSGAFGANEICLIIPCHRVIGKNNKLTGYGGEIENKENLLKLESSKYK